MLKLPCCEDIPAITSFYQQNSSYLNKYSPSVRDGFFNADFWRKRTKESQDDFENDRACHFFIFQKKTGKIIGYVNFFNFIRGSLQGCTLGYGLAEESQGHGLMTEALELSISYVMQKLNIHRIEANYHPNNHKSAKLLKNFGFLVEGIAGCYLRINGQWEPHILTSLTNHDWKECQAEN